MAKTVTIRLLDGKEQVYEDFKETVIEKLHSDICYVTTMLMESFNQALAQNPDAEPITMTFVRQNIQINMGCNFNYYTKKARRTPEDLTEIITDKHTLIPEVITQFPTMSANSKDWWIEELRSQGFQIIDPSVSTAKPKSTFIIKLRHLWSIVKHLFA